MSDSAALQHCLETALVHSYILRFNASLLLLLRHRIYVFKNLFSRA